LIFTFYLFEFLLYVVKVLAKENIPSMYHSSGDSRQHNYHGHSNQRLLKIDTNATLKKSFRVQANNSDSIEKLNHISNSAALVNEYMDAIKFDDEANGYYDGSLKKKKQQLAQSTTGPVVTISAYQTPSKQSNQQANFSSTTITSSASSTSSTSASLIGSTKTNVPAPPPPPPPQSSSTNNQGEMLIIASASNTLTRVQASHTNNKNNNNMRTLKSLKKSISFTKPIASAVGAMSNEAADVTNSSEEHSGYLKESTPLFNKMSNGDDNKNEEQAKMTTTGGLLTTVRAAAAAAAAFSTSSAVIEHNKLSASTPTGSSEHAHSSSKMITFSSGAAVMQSAASASNKKSTPTIVKALNGVVGSAHLSSMSSSTSGSASSPTTSSTNNDSEFTANSDSPNANGCAMNGMRNIERDKLIVNDDHSAGLMNGAAHSSLTTTSLIRQPKLSTFSTIKRNTSAAAMQNGHVKTNYDNLIDSAAAASLQPARMGSYSSTASQCVTLSIDGHYNHSSPSSTPNEKQNSKLIDLLETRFLNKLCEDIEVSLNVDCECADDYSSNDFSGDYSFDNELKSPAGSASATVTNLIKARQQAQLKRDETGPALANVAAANGSMPHSSRLTDLRKARDAFEESIKQLRGTGLKATISANGAYENHNGKSHLPSSTTHISNGKDRGSISTKSHLGVLV
jgi:trimeric autotransporter adhesin